MGEPEMKKLLRVEEAFLFGLSIFLFSRLSFPWWYFPAFLFIPDIGMLGYTVNTRAGAVIYNIFHHRGLSIGLYIAGAWLGFPVLQFIGLILFAHATLDRVFDYGLKYSDSFKHTHLN